MAFYYEKEMDKLSIIADLSEWQETVDFAKLSKVVDGVILRVQAGYTHTDSKYKEYVAGCKANNIPFGTYAYFKGVSVPDAITEAKHAYSLIDKDSKFFALDIEEVTCSNLITSGQAFINYLKNQGVKNVGLYSGESFYKAHNLAGIKADWNWIANYGVNNGKQNNKPGISCDIWQFTSVGRLNGISGNVDLNVVLGKDLFHTVIPTPPKAPVAPSVQARKVIMHVKALTVSDIRADHSHTSGFVRNTKVGETFSVFGRTGDWHDVGIGWIDGAKGHNLYWLDNPALKGSAPQPVYYVIQSGDTLSKIATANGTTVTKLQTLNGIKNPDAIIANQKIRVK